MELKRVVVTGLGALTPVGNNLEETWENIVKGVSGAAPIKGFDASQFKTRFACEVKNFQATDFIDRKEIRKMDLYEQYALVAAMEAVKDSGMNLETIDKTRWAWCWASASEAFTPLRSESANTRSPKKKKALVSIRFSYPR